MYRQIWVVSANCGDYYCGCGAGHLIAICDTSERANEVSALASAQKRPLGGYDRWDEVTITSIPMNEMDDDGEWV